MSSGCQDLLGISPAAVVADLNCLIDLTYADDLQSFSASVAESASKLTFFIWEGRVCLPTGEVKWIELTSRPELQPDGAIVGMG